MAAFQRPWPARACSCRPPLRRRVGCAHSSILQTFTKHLSSASLCARASSLLATPVEGKGRQRGACVGAGCSARSARGGGGGGSSKPFCRARLRRTGAEDQGRDRDGRVAWSPGGSRRSQGALISGFCAPPKEPSASLFYPPEPIALHPPLAPKGLGSFPRIRALSSRAHPSVLVGDQDVVYSSPS